MAQSEREVTKRQNEMQQGINVNSKNFFAALSKASALF